jgi:hypothetical protein
MGSIIPPDGMSAACAQVYILDSAEQVETRQALPWGASLDSNLLTSLGDMLQTHNVLVQHFKAAAELDAPNLQIGQTVYVNENANNLFHLPLPSILPHFLPALVSLPWSPFPPGLQLSLEAPADCCLPSTCGQSSLQSRHGARGCAVQARRAV